MTRNTLNQMIARVVWDTDHGAAGIRKRQDRIVEALTKAHTRWRVEALHLIREATDFPCAKTELLGTPAHLKLVEYDLLTDDGCLTPLGRIFHAHAHKARLEVPARKTEWSDVFSAKLVLECVIKANHRGIQGFAFGNRGFSLEYVMEALKSKGKTPLWFKPAGAKMLEDMGVFSPVQEDGYALTEVGVAVLLEKRLEDTA